LEHDARTEMLRVQNKDSLRAEGYYADVGTKWTINECLTYTKQKKIKNMYRISVAIFMFSRERNILIGSGNDVNICNWKWL